MNHADPRLAPAQAIVNAAMQTARDRGESARMVGTIGDSTRQLVTDRIKTFMDAISLAAAVIWWLE